MKSVKVHKIKLYLDAFCLLTSGNRRKEEGSVWCDVMWWAGKRDTGTIWPDVWGSTHLFNRDQPTSWAFEAKDCSGQRTGCFIFREDQGKRQATLKLLIGEIPEREEKRSCEDRHVCSQVLRRRQIKSEGQQRKKCWAWKCTRPWLWDHSGWRTASTEVRAEKRKREERRGGERRWEEGKGEMGKSWGEERWGFPQVRGIICLNTKHSVKVFGTCFAAVILNINFKQQRWLLN